MQRAFSLILFIFFCFSLRGEIITSDSLDPLFQQIPYLCPNDLVIFDVDDTLITPKDAILRPKSHILRNFLTLKYGKLFDKESKDLLISTMLSQRKIQLVNPHLPLLIRELQAAKIPVIALTAARPGKYGNISSMEEWREKELKSLNIDFSSSFSNIKPFVFSEFSVKSSPAFDRGIIYSSCAPKGDVLKAFLERIVFRPRRVIFFDDRLQQVQCVEKSLASMGICDYFGIHYLESSEICSAANPEIADFQFRYLVENKEWLSDSEAQMKLELTEKKALNNNSF